MDLKHGEEGRGKIGLSPQLNANWRRLQRNRQHARNNKAREKAVGPFSKGSDLTVTIPHFLVQSDDVAFREFIADLFAAASGMQALRRALADSVRMSAAEFSILLATWCLQKKGKPRISAIARHLHIAPAHVTAEVGKARVVVASEEKPGRQRQPRRRHHSNEKG